MKICVVTYMYPNKYSSSDFVFVKNLVDEFARNGHECVVVCPFSTLHYKHWIKCTERYNVGNNTVKVIHPNYFSTSNLKIGSKLLAEIIFKLYTRLILNVMSFKPDVVYCHFWKQGIVAYPYAKKHNIPLFVASGECEIFVNNYSGSLDKFRDYVSGVICVSSKNRDESVKLRLTTPGKCYIAPNSIDNNIFRLMDKQSCRAKLQLPQNAFIIAFVGWFANRKGTMRVSDAIKSIDSDDVFSLFIGEGPEKPDCKNILFCGKLAHEEVATYLNAADVFVLPTLQEGCCNAVVEAMACGKPIISSDLPFNWDVLNAENSIMVNPMNVDEIKSAIVKLKDNYDLRKRMSQSALISAEKLSISQRANNIISFIKSTI